VNFSEIRDFPTARSETRPDLSQKLGRFKAKYPFEGEKQSSENHETTKTAKSTKSQPVPLFAGKNIRFGISPSVSMGIEKLPMTSSGDVILSLTRRRRCLILEISIESRRVSDVSSVLALLSVGRDCFSVWV